MPVFVRTSLHLCGMQTISINHAMNIVGDLQGPRVILIAGRPSAGKTDLILNLAVNLAVNDSVPVAIFSPGQSGAQLALKIYHLLMEAPVAFPEVQDSLKGLPLYIDDTQSQTLEEFARKLFD